MNPLKTETIKEIEYILKGCRSGELEHNQSSYTCGTAHCIAGWHIVLKYSDSKEQLDHSAISEYATPWLETQEDWGLTESEANILFSVGATFKYQFALLEWFKQGKRIKDLPYEFSDSLRYSNEDIPEVYVDLQNIYNYCDKEGIEIESPRFLELKESLLNAQEFVEFCCKKSSQ